MRSHFLVELQNYKELPENVGHCFVAWAERLLKMYVQYCRNKDASNAVIVSDEATRYFEVSEKNVRGVRFFFFADGAARAQATAPDTGLPDQAGAAHHQVPAAAEGGRRCAAWFSPTTQDLCACCDQSEDQGEIKEALDVMLNVPKKANDSIHLSLLRPTTDHQLVRSID